MNEVKSEKERKKEENNNRFKEAKMEYTYVLGNTMEVTQVARSSLLICTLYVAHYSFVRVCSTFGTLF